MALYVKVLSNQAICKQDLVLLHGWGFNGAVWNELLPNLLDSGYRIYIVDLPGHGQSTNLYPPLKIEGWAESVWEVVPNHAIWIGWSLGGMVALVAAAIKPKAIRALITIGCSPRFTQCLDWSAALAPELLIDFGNLLQTDWRATLSRFLALQITPNKNQTLRRLRSLLLDHPPELNALNIGLDILQTTDLRQQLSKISCPTLVLLGERDTLVPKTVSKYLAQLKPNWEIYIFNGAGHLPFITHQTEFINIIQHWISGI